jgi:hypothetical protein
MPCRVSYDVHEWIHEDPAVPAYNPVNPPAGRTVQRLPVGQEDPVELYCSQSLGRGCVCRAYVGAYE